MKNEQLENIKKLTCLIVEDQIENIINQFCDIWEKSLILLGSTSVHIPARTIHTYNTMLTCVGYVQGWNSETRIETVRAHLDKYLLNCIKIFNSGAMDLTDTVQPELVNLYSPVHILNMYVPKIEKELSLTPYEKSILYSLIAFYELAYFRIMGREVLEKRDESPLNIEQTSGLVYIQSHLMIAQEAIATASVFLSEDAIQELENRKLSSATKGEKALSGLVRGGSDAHWRRHKGTIEKHINSKQEHRLTHEQIKDLIESSTGIRPPNTTYTDWVKKIKDHGSIYKGKVIEG